MELSRFINQFKDHPEYKKHTVFGDQIKILAGLLSSSSFNKMDQENIITEVREVKSSK
jgi:hypothetical protein